MSILTGRSPRSTGAMFNLIRREDVNDYPTIADLLATEGYTTVFATDEVRFSNIDESYGFDRIITPPIGAADFLIGQVGDLPLSNVVANTPLGWIPAAVPSREPRSRIPVPTRDFRRSIAE